MAHDIWQDNIKLMLNGCHYCWSYKAIKFAFDAKLIDFNPDINIFSMQTFSEVCSISFNEEIILTLFMRKGILVLSAFARKQHLVKVTLSANILGRNAWENR